jgi:hypothetical protein
LTDDEQTDLMLKLEEARKALGAALKRVEELQQSILTGMEKRGTIVPVPTDIIAEVEDALTFDV